jgi:raffinose/stachyose/melibiose transport system permease protein
MGKKVKSGRIIIGIFFLLLGLSFVFPLFWMLNLSFKTTDDIYTRPFGFPSPFIVTNYPKAIAAFPFVRYLLNSLFYSSASVCIVLLLSSMLAYYLSRLQTRFSSLIMSYIVLGLVIPGSATIIPKYIMLQKAGLINSRLGLILIYSAGISSAVLMLYAFLRSLPKELEEAAYIDGSSVYGAFFRIIVPCIRPALFTQAVILFMNIWNDFFTPFIFTTSDRLKTLQVGIAGFFQAMNVNQWGMITAAMVLSSLPVIIVFLIFSEQIENALTAGAILK